MALAAANTPDRAKTVIPKAANPTPAKSNAERFPKGST